MQVGSGGKLRKSGVSSLFWGTVLFGVAALLIIVALLQYRWTSQLSAAAELRLGSKLESQMMSWSLDFYGELSAICVALQVGPDSGTHDTWNDYLQRYRDWSHVGSTNSVENIYANPDLVQDIYIWETGSHPAQAIRFNPQVGRIEHSSVPPHLGKLFARLTDRSSSLPVALRAWESDPEVDEANAARNRRESQLHLLRSNAITGWQFDATVPAIIHPLVHSKVHHKAGVSQLSPGGPVDWIVVVLNLDTIQNRILPALARRYFTNENDAFEYKVAVLGEAAQRGLFYSSDPSFRQGESGTYDSKMNIFGPPPESVEGHLWQSVKNTQALGTADWKHFSAPVWFPVIQYSLHDEPWTLYLEHRQGPLEAAVKNVRRSNLITGGVVLVLLATSMILVLIASRRAQNLANLQMNFVASISHELRTPLTAILSAGQNIRDGFVGDLPRYGLIITTQARQLIDLVDQTLLFASIKSGREIYRLDPLNLNDVLDDVRHNIFPSLEQAGFTVHIKMTQPLPLIMGDRQALFRCVQNLVNNAGKYSGNNRFIAVESSREELNAEVTMTVTDHGLGIDSAEIERIFEPFYRSPRVVTAQIHGTGLGLSVVKHIVESMGGRVSVTSKVESGSTFKLHFPVASEQEATSHDLVESETSA
jgi:signal transduction histidine kinase